jgi:hypothetical protein
MEKKITADYIINRLLSEFGFKNISKTDIYEFIGTAVQELGYGLFEDIVYKQAPINFFRIAYPCDSLQVLNVYYKGKILPPKRCNDYQKISPFGWLEEVVVSGLNHLSVENFDTLEYGLDREKLLSEVIDSLAIIQNQNRVLVDTSNYVEYLDKFINTSIEEGNVYLEYTTFALDENGVPYLHDEIKYLNAILYYCAFILIQSGYQHPTISYPNALELKNLHFTKAVNEERKMNSIQKRAFLSTWTNVLKDSTKDYKFNNG